MFFIKGLLIGLIFGIPIGAVGTLTLQRTINHDGKIGFITGLGSSIADILYAFIGVFGITIISDFLLEYQTIINIVGGIFILILGIETIRKKVDIQKEEEKQSIKKMFLSSFIIGITNPATILSFIFAFTYFNIMGQVTLLNGLLLVLGVLLGTIIWWSILVFIGNKIKKNINEKRLRNINKILGILLILFSLIIILRTVL